MNTKKTRTYDIVAGPNRDALFDACKYAYDKTAKLPIGFTVAIAYTAPKNTPDCNAVIMAITDIKIMSIEHEDGSGESFNLNGYCRANPDSLRRDGVTCKTYEFEAYYNAKSRKGFITLIERQ